MKKDSRKLNTSIAGQSAEYYIAMDDSLASLLLNHGIKVRDFVLLSFLSDQGPMSVSRLSGVVDLTPDETLDSLQRLSAVDLVSCGSIAKLTSRGKEIAGKINSELE